MNNSPFLKATAHPENSQSPGVSSTEIYLAVDGILALRPLGSNNFDVILKPDYLDLISSWAFDKSAKLKSITATIRNEMLP
jgi:hypothetical protein